MLVSETNMFYCGNIMEYTMLFVRTNKHIREKRKIDEHDRHMAKTISIYGKILKEYVIYSYTIHNITISMSSKTCQCDNFIIIIMTITIQSTTAWVLKKSTQ